MLSKDEELNMSNIISRFREKDQVLFAEVEKLKNGDAESFNTIYELSKNYIFKIIWDIVKSQDAADDIMQETYLQIYNKVSGLADTSAFYSWAGRIATNFCLTYIKREKKYVLAEADESGEAEDFIFERASDDHEAMIPESIIMNKEQQRIIADILDSLSTEQKLCVQYYYFEELSVKEIAEIMETSEGTVKSRLNYARKSIKSAVENIERRDGTKLYSISAFPLLFLIFREGADIMFGAVTASAAGAAGTAAAGSASMDGGAVTGTAVSAQTASAAATKSASIGLKILLACVATTVVVGGSILIFSKDKDTDDKNRIEERTEYHIDNSGAFDVSDNNTEEPTSIGMTDDTFTEKTESSSNYDHTKYEDYVKSVTVVSAWVSLTSDIYAYNIVYSALVDSNDYVILRVDPLDGGGANVSLVSAPAEFMTNEESTSGIYTIDDCLEFMNRELSGEDIMLEYTENGADCYYIMLYQKIGRYCVALGQKDIVPELKMNSDNKITVSGAYMVHPYCCEEYLP